MLGEACKIIMLALASLDKAGLASSLERADATFSLAGWKIQQGFVAEALTILEACLALEISLFGPRHPRTDQVKRTLEEIRKPLVWKPANPDAARLTVEMVIEKAKR